MWKDVCVRVYCSCVVFFCLFVCVCVSVLFCEGVCVRVCVETGRIGREDVSVTK